MTAMSSSVNLHTPTQPAAHTRFIFVKTHKTGSSTVANLLHTYAVRNNLSFVALPPTPGGVGQRWNLRNPAVQRAVRAANPGGEAVEDHAQLVVAQRAQRAGCHRLGEPRLAASRARRARRHRRQTPPA